MAKRSDSETFSLGESTRHRLQVHAKATGIKKAEIVRQGVNLFMQAADLKISPELYGRSLSLLGDAYDLLNSYVNEMGQVCDHEAGICLCGERAVVQGIAEHLEAAGVKLEKGKEADRNAA